MQMKRLTTLFLTLAALLLALPASVSAQSGKVLTAGSRITLSQITDGMEFLLEGATETSSNGKYMPQLPTSDKDAYITASLDSGSIYRLVKATGNYATNQYTNQQQWWIQNVKTGGFVTASNGYYILKNDKFDASLFVINSADTLQSKLGTKPKADAPIGYDVNSVTFCIPTSDSTGTFINNHYFVTIAGNGVIRAWSYNDTNPWNMRTPVWSSSYIDQLKAYYEDFPESRLSDYAYGTNPGYLNDENLIENLTNAYNAVTDAIDGISDEDQAKTLLENLQNAYTAIQDKSKIVAMPDEGYFYIKVADPQIKEKQPEQEYAICPMPNTDDQIGWQPFTDDYKFIWHIQKGDSGYVVKNASTGVYIDQPQSIDNSVPMLTSTTNKTEQMFRLFTPNGTWHILSAPGVADNLLYNMNGHSGGNGKGGNIVTWYDDGDVGSRWTLEAVPQDIVDALNNNADLTALKNLISTCPDATKLASIAGTNPYQYSQDAVTAYTTAYTAANSLVENTGSTDEYKSALANLQSALTTLNNSRVKLTAGYYKVVNAYPQYYIQQKVRKVMSCNTTDLTWGSEVDGDASQIWKITPVEGDTTGTKFIAQNVMNSYYMGRPASAKNSQAVKSSATPDTIIVTPYNESADQVKLFSVFAPNISFHTNGHGGGAGKGSNIVLWNTDMDGASSWKIEATTLPADLSVKHLQNLLPTAKKTLSKAYAYNYDSASPYIKDASQFFGVNQEKSEGHIEALIDGVKKTDNTAQNYYHTSWSGTVPEGAQPGDTLINAYHALGVKAGETAFPDPMVIAFTTRTQNNNLAPTEMNIMASTDSVTWTNLGTIYNTTVKTGDTDWNSVAITGASAYKYVRMDVVSTVTNSKDKYGHPYFALLEFNLYPSAGLAASAEINDADVKANAEALSALITADEAKVAAGSATEDDVTALQEAIDKLQNSYRDTTELAAKIAEAKNLDLTVGTELGNVSQDAFTEFQNAIAPVLAAQPLYKLNKAQIAANLATLDAALEKIRASIVLPDGKTWYYIASANTALNDDNGNPSYLYQGYNTPGNAMKNQTISSDELAGYTRNAWNLETVGSKVYIRNVGNGLYQASNNIPAGSPSTSLAVADTMPTADGFVLIPLGEEQYAFKAANSDLYLVANTTNQGNVDFAAAPSTSMKGTRYAFTLTEVSTMAQEVSSPQTSIRKGSYKAFMLPVPISAVTSDEDATFHIYQIVGKTTNADGATTAINLKENTLGTPLPAGTPFILLADGDYTSGDMTGVFNFLTEVSDADIKFAADTVNGLIGVAKDIALNKAGLGYIDVNNNRDKVTPTTTTSVTIGIQSAYINPALITETGETPDATIEVLGSIVNSINKATINSGAAAKVNVYTIDGVLVKKNVNAANATDGLSKGIYIVGKKKVSVK